MAAVWFLGVAAGLLLAIRASRHALDAAVSLGEKLGLSRFVIGVTIVAVGTDLPEMANSVIASATNNGDVNIGNSVGSVVTQITIVLGVLCFLKGLVTTKRFAVTVGALTVLSLLMGAFFVSDGYFGRQEAGLLIATWIAGTFIIQRPTGREEPVDEQSAGTFSLVRRTAGSLILVVVGATIAVESFTRAAETLGVPEFLLSFFVLAAGTSLPELVIDYRALRKGEGALAMGDLLGSSFIDATLSPALGPLLFPHALSSGLERGSLAAALVVTAVTALLVFRPRPTRWTGFWLILLYLALYPLLLL